MTDKTGPLYKRKFKMLAGGADKKTVRATIPRDVVMREAERRGLSFEDFLKSYNIQWEYNGFEGVIGTFVEITK